MLSLCLYGSGKHGLNLCGIRDLIQCANILSDWSSWWIKKQMKLDGDFFEARVGTLVFFFSAFTLLVG